MLKSARMKRKKWQRLVLPIMLGSISTILIIAIVLATRELNILSIARKTQTEQLTTLNAKNRHLEEMSQRLREKTLDIDLLDERARAVLGLIGRNETRIQIDDNTGNP